jgi:N-ethylmaleimide reductase
MPDSSPRELFPFVIQERSRRNIAYLHLLEARGFELRLGERLHENALGICLHAR